MFEKERRLVCLYHEVDNIPSAEARRIVRKKIIGEYLGVNEGDVIGRVVELGSDEYVVLTKTGMDTVAEELYMRTLVEKLEKTINRPLVKVGEGIYRWHFNTLVRRKEKRLSKVVSTGEKRRLRTISAGESIITKLNDEANNVMTDNELRIGLEQYNTRIQTVEQNREDFINSAKRVSTEFTGIVSGGLIWVTDSVMDLTAFVLKNAWEVVRWLGEAVVSKIKSKDNLKK